MRQIILDTETTGLSTEAGHRIIEIGCLEMIDRRLTGNKFHEYINPEVKVEQGAVQVHGITNEFLKDKPLFKEIIQELIDFISGAELIIHNAEFDVGFLNHEFKLAKYTKKIEQLCRVIDTLTLARKKHPGQRNSLDALCKRYNVDNSNRNLHGALLDAELLALVYLALTGGQGSLFGGADQARDFLNEKITAPTSLHAMNLPVILANEEEKNAHDQFLALIKNKSGGTNVWEKLFSEDNS